MRTCDTCGEQIPAQALLCPYCDTPQPAAIGGRPAGPAVRTIDVEAGLPTVADALRRLQAQLDRARADGVRVVRVIHGWGSMSGGGGKIRAAAGHWLRGEHAEGRVGAVLFGDNFASTCPPARDFLRRHPALRPYERSDRNNSGIAFVEP